MNTQPDPLRYAEILENSTNYYPESSSMPDLRLADIAGESAAMLRTQHADLERKDALLRQALAVAEESQTYVGSATWSPSMTNELNELCLAITKELAK